LRSLQEIQPNFVGRPRPKLGCGAEEGEKIQLKGITPLCSAVLNDQRFDGPCCHHIHR